MLVFFIELSSLVARKGEGWAFIKQLIGVYQ